MKPLRKLVTRCFFQFFRGLEYCEPMPLSYDTIKIGLVRQLLSAEDINEFLNLTLQTFLKQNSLMRLI